MSQTDARYILAIDLGTSSCKVALLTARGQILGSAGAPVPLQLLPNGGAEQDPAAWWAAIKSATRQLLDQGLVPPAAIVAICCTAQWSGTVPVDRSGNPLHNAIIWMDARGARYVQQITGGLLKLSGYGVDKLWHWLRLTGGIPTRSGKDPIAHILYIKHELPALYAQTYKFLEPKDYLNLRLTGQFAASRESITLHWVTDNRDINTIDYDERLLKLATLDREKLPDLKRADEILGTLRPEVAAELGLSAHTQVIMGTPDLHSAAIGSGAVNDYAAHLYIGTSSWLACHVPFKKTDLFHNMAALPSALPNRYLLINEQESAGGCLTFFQDNLLYPADELATTGQPDDLYTRFEQMLSRIPPGSGNLIFTPWLNGERSPINDSNMRGGFHNVSLHTTRAHLLRAIYEGVAYNSRWLLGCVEKFVGRRLDVIRLIGGGARSAAWCQIYADVLDRPIAQVQDPVQANARGAGLLAALALGYLRTDEMADCVPVAHTYVPNSQTRATYDHLFAEFVKLYGQNQRIYGRLNRNVK